MLTVILFFETEKELLLKYEFVFVNFQTNHQIALCEWKSEMKEKDVYQKLDSLTSEHNEWKLLIFGGEMSLPGRDLSAARLDRFYQLLTVYTGAQGLRHIHTVKGFLPAAVWYVGYQEKRIRIRSGASAFKTVDSGRKFGSSFRAIWFEVDFTSNMQRQFDLFRMTCGILVLALNDIPSYYLECGFLYQMDIVVRRSDFAKYVVLLREQFRQIRELAQTAYQQLELDYQTRSAYPQAGLKKSDLAQNRQKLAGNVPREKISANDIVGGVSLEKKLDINRRWLRSQLYFPKGVLQQELEKMQAGVDAAPGAGYRLNEAAWDRVEREQQSTLEKMRTQRKIRSKLNETLKEIKAVEKDMLLKKERWQWGGEKWVVLAALSAAEIIMLLPFCLAEPPLFGMPDWLECLIVLAAAPAGFCGMFLISEKWDSASSAGKYEKKLNADIEHSQDDRLRYMEETMNLIAEYQYGIRLKKEDLERLAVLDQRKRTLGRHMSVLENGEAVCRQLAVLLGEEEMKTAPSVSRPSINFMDDPNEVEYYWMPYRHSTSMAEINGSGDMVNAFFNFISKVVLRKTPDAQESALTHL